MLGAVSPQYRRNLILFRLANEMTATPQELPRPHAADRDPYATEMIRAWVAEGQLHAQLHLGEWLRDGKVDEASAWGVVLADIARHIASGLQEITGEEQSAQLTRLVASLNAAIRDVS